MESLNKWAGSPAEREPEIDSISEGLKSTEDVLSTSVPTNGQEQADRIEDALASFYNGVLKRLKYTYENRSLKQMLVQDGEAVMAWEGGFRVGIAVSQDGKSLQVDFDEPGYDTTRQNMTPRQAYEAVDTYIKEKVLESK